MRCSASPGCRINHLTHLMMSRLQYLIGLWWLSFHLISLRVCGSHSLVLAMVPGYPAAVRIWNRTGWSSPDCYPENSSTYQVLGQVVTGPLFHYMVPTTLAPIIYLNSDRIATSSIREMCRLMPCFISHSQICDHINIDWVALKLSWKSRQNDRDSIATPQQLVRLPIGKWHMKEGIKLHISHIDYLAMRWELQYLIGARDVDFWRAGFGWKPVAMVRFQVGPGPRTEQGIWTRC